MTVHKGTQYTKQYVSTTGKADRNVNMGKFYRLYDEYLTSESSYAIGDTVLGPRIPAGAIVVGGGISHEAITSCTDCDFGWQATKDGDGNTLAADADGFFDGTDISSAGTSLVSDQANAAGMGQKFGQETQTVLLFNVAPTSSSSEKIKFWVDVIY